MLKIPLWVTALHISLDDYSEWLQMFPSPEFVLSWAIENKHVNELDYMKWASFQYKLPVLKSDFFKKDPPLEMWKKYFGGPWSPTVLPLYEWQGTLFVGVLEPKNFVLNNIKVQLVIVPSTAQNNWWHHFAQLQKTLSPDVTPTPTVFPRLKPPPPVPPPPADYLRPGITSLVLPEKVSTTIVLPERPNVPLGLAEPVIELPEVPPEELEMNTSTPNPVSQEMLQEIEILGEEVLEILQSNSAPIATPKLEELIYLPPDGFDLKMDPIAATPLPQTESVFEDGIPEGLSVEAEFVAQKPVLEGVMPAGLDLIEIPDVELNSLDNLIADQGVKVFELSKIIAPLVSKKIDLPTPMVAPQKIETEENGLSGIPEGHIKSTLEKLRPHFERGMVLLKQDGLLRPYQWDQTWPMDKNESGDLELTLPSLFKIVVDSKHPFHGNVRPSKSNDMFFKKWNGNKYPYHVTALPLKAQDEVFGILVAITSFEKTAGIVLGNFEKIADDLSKQLAETLRMAA